ncbi:MAG: CBS domain-containing protein [Marinobacter sp.]
MSYLDSEFYQPLFEAVASGDEAQIQAAAATYNAADLAEFVDEHPDKDEGIRLLRALPTERSAKVFGYIGPGTQTLISGLLSTPGLAELVTAMSSDERADFFNLLDESRQHTLLQSLARKEREDLRRLASFEEGTAGALMSSDYAVINTGMSASAAINLLRNTAPDKETIYQAFVIDSNHKLLGAVSLKNLITALPGTPVDDLIATGLVTANTHTPQEDVARLIARYDLLALPILDHEQRLVGIVTYDDAMDVAEAEATEDIHKGATVGKLAGSLRDATPFSLYRSRVQWLIILVFANIFTGAGIAYFEAFYNQGPV